MKGFRRFGGIEIEDLGKYTRDYIAMHKDVKIYVGTDSEAFRRALAYATVVLFYHPGKGAHFVFRTDFVPRVRPKVAHKPGTTLEDLKNNFDAVRDLHPKLWGEVERSFEVAEYLETELTGFYPRLVADQKLVDVDLDLNPSKKWLSNLLHDAGVGFFVGNGYRVRTKPKAWSASSAADLITRRSRRRRKPFGEYVKERNDNLKKKAR